MIVTADLLGAAHSNGDVVHPKDEMRPANPGGLVAGYALEEHPERLVGIVQDRVAVAALVTILDYGDRPVSADRTARHHRGR